MDRERFDSCADRLLASANELQATTEDYLVQATELLSGVNPTGLAGASPDESGTSVALGQVARGGSKT